MAGYQEHISVSGFLGVVYGAAAVFGFGFSVVQGILAAVFTWVAGMLPDLDSETGKPVREVFSLLAAAAPLTMMPRLLEWGGDTETAMLLAVVTYIVVRYGGAVLVNKMAVHRGMFHSIPALLIVTQLTFLAYKSDAISVRVVMAGGAALGFLSHLLLDELYSVEWTGIRLKLNQAAGSAVKLFGNNLYANIVAYALLATVTYTTLVDVGILNSLGPDHLQGLIHAKGPEGLQIP